MSVPPRLWCTAQGAVLIATSFLMGGLVCYTAQQQHAGLAQVGRTSGGTSLVLRGGGGDGEQERGEHAAQPPEPPQQEQLAPQMQPAPGQQRAAPAAAPNADGLPLLPVVDRPPGTRFHRVPCPGPHPPGTRRRNLVFAAVGDSWSPDRWGYSKHASWDLVAVYFGKNASWSCPQCTASLRMPRSFKWQMVWRLMTEAKSEWAGIWDRWRRRYDYVMVADDDLVMEACTLDLVFQSMARHGLLAAQPSNCRGNDSDNPYWNHWQLPGLELHYVNVLEVTAPAFAMRYLDRRVRPLLNISYSGWGLPYCFSAITRFSRNKLAAIDTTCMLHPAREAVGRRMSVSERIRHGLFKPDSIYAQFSKLTPFGNPLVEQREVWNACGLTQEYRNVHPQAPVVYGVQLAPGAVFEGPPAEGLTAEAAAAEAGGGAEGGRRADEQQQQADEQQQRREQPGDEAERRGGGGGAAAAEQWLEAEQRQFDAALGGGLLHAPLLLLAVFGLGAAAGVLAALQWDRRGKGGWTHSQHAR